MNPLVTIVTASGTAILAWILSRNKYRAEVRKITAEAVQIEIGNAKAVINFWKETAEDLTLQMAKLSDNCEKLSYKCGELMVELELVRTENEELKKKLEQVR